MYYEENALWSGLNVMFVCQKKLKVLCLYTAKPVNKDHPSERQNMDFIDN